MLKSVTTNVLRNGQKAFVCYEYKCQRTYCKKEAQEYPKRIFSGIQPTGIIHIGNYLGAIERWKSLQNTEKEVLWSIVDMHSITLTQEPQKLKENILLTTAILLACGIDPKKSVLFQQSTVPMHSELCWVLGCITTMARLSHLPQFKEKSQTVKNVPLGLYIYPVLQAADILLYRATEVPVGQDQVQHIQLAQILATIFNTKFGETFPIPHSMVDGSCQKIKSLRDPTKKMSKSDTDEKSRINLTDTPDTLRNKIKKAVTDFTSAVTYDPVGRPGVSNLILIHSLLTGQSFDDVCKGAKDLDTGEYKLVLADVVIEKLTPIRERTAQYLNEPEYLEEVLKDGKERAIELATDCWQEVREKVGFDFAPKRSKAKRLHSAS